MPSELRSVHDAVIFISCADEDREFLEELHRALSSLLRDGRVDCRHRYRLNPGAEWRQQTRKDLWASDIILLLVSPFFVSCDHCYEEEAELAMTQHRNGKSHVIPIIVRPIVGLEQLVFGSLKNLPEGKAVSMWSNKEDAFANIVKGVKGVIDDLKWRTQSTSKQLLYWNVPYWQNPFFTGRGDVLQALREAFTSQQKPLYVQAVSGLPGIGKTQTAIEYAYRYAESYQAVLWVYADSPEILLASFVELAEVLGLPQRNEASQPLIVRAVKQWLQRNSRWLLIVDNLEDIDLLRDVVPSPHTGHIHVTTRAHRTGQVAHRVNLAPMDIDDGALLLLRRAKLLNPSANLSDALEADNVAAKKLAHEVHGLPLALDQAGAYIEETGRGLSDYASLYQQHSSSLLNRRGASGPDHPASVTTTFSLTFEKIKTLNPTAIELLEFCAFLHPDAIPEEMIIDGASVLSPLLRVAATDPIELDRAIEDLLKFSFVRREPNRNILIVHRLVQIVVKDTLDKEREQEYIEQVIRVIETVFPSAEFSNWSRCQRYLPQAQACAKLIQQRNVLLPEASQLLYRLGTYLYQRGLYDQAEVSLMHASVVKEALAGTDHHEIIPLLNALALVYYKQGKYPQIEPLLLRSLALSEQTLEMEHAAIGESLSTLGKTYEKQGRYSEAEPLLQHALALGQKILGSQHPDVAVSLSALGTFYSNQGKYDQAEALYTQALVIRRAILDPQHPNIAAILNNLAVLYRRQRKYDQAEPLAEQAVKIYEQALGHEHFDVLNALDTLASIYQERGKYAEAEPLYQRIFTVFNKQFGPEHPRLVEYSTNLARLYFLQGKYMQAEITAQQALKLAGKVLGANLYQLCTSRKILADIYKAQERYAEAEELYKQVIEIHEQIPVSNDIRATTLESYADLLQRTGRLAEAEGLRKQATLIRDEHSTE